LRTEISRVHSSSNVRAAAEDLKFFYRHIDEGGELFRVDDV
jgi:hypothetical protein